MKKLGKIRLCVDSFIHDLEFHVMLKTETDILIMRKISYESLSIDDLQIAKVVTQKEADFIFHWMEKNQKWIVYFEFPMIRFTSA